MCFFLSTNWMCSRKWFWRYKHRDGPMLGQGEHVSPLKFENLIYYLYVFNFNPFKILFLFSAQLNFTQLSISLPALISLSLSFQSLIFHFSKKFDQLNCLKTTMRKLPHWSGIIDMTLYENTIYIYVTSFISKTCMGQSHNWGPAESELITYKPSYNWISLVQLLALGWYQFFFSYHIWGQLGKLHDYPQ